ncbi:chemotaxis protein CheW [Clostridium chauvoei]|uniref:Chemotaxis protein CheW n=2 Tax=Clostridium chauvoei TaxID=46867 RepID=A0ABD4RI47_9CLOT|nr:chemotaxis protein CheW [Clostridium chauvoei]ATD54611.1 chemotaxis protein CheW [Clostridium chauvoei]ATD57708.1 chemotaxis protein CheW [Clostridium chauvoei]MBX7281023.1 chemotaxis protein CheW [Clostridium chauvoei]MBX7283476.1 chemotaxis protein CheW [Clostridium chauvoei]MBX7286112.1 chemotaxis protein CheW [Clostridium chauvoei]
MQFVVFKLGKEHFAVETEKIQSINDMMSITKVPKSPIYIKGLINLRGSIKSLVDINLLLNINSNKQQNNIIILKLDEEEIGIAVDEVEEVIDIDDNNLQQLESHNQGYLRGVIDLNGKLLTIIDIEKLLNQ